MMQRTLYLGAGAFEAARHTVAANHPTPRLHGHSFRIEYTGLSDQWVELTKLCQYLDLSYLNDYMACPDNEGLLSWFRSRLDNSSLQRLQLWSGPQYGLTYLSQGDIQTWFRSRFEAAHYLPHVPANHKCGRLHGHGFEVLIYCAPAKQEQVRQVWGELYARLNHQLLNEIEGLSNPTSEMLAHWIWHYFNKLSTPVSEVTVFETRSTGSVYNGKDFYIWKEFSFDSATQQNSHTTLGHTYILRVGLSSSLDNVFQWVEDFGDVKKIFAPWIDQLDHQPLHHYFGSGSSLECLNWLSQQAITSLPTVTRLSLWQTPQEGVRQEYSPLSLWVE
ncbi:6-carboxy-5,6,7,8-tetrahydropterin synthase [Ferrovum sp. JA12]|uniref:6-pyruvoyl trahydropterin synthase family protein n=1 Tax=Ferrovum sp. JA12 TaxID=1356299 RepID=UPI00071327F7|nr:6-carboxytetrahydropterin synthase [Ferrovum sp. JA12]KRH79768.1 6-carboxy-5,6,7,8-tetrahydropterin synthase [Ferrovum sp. JA12]